MKSAYFFLFDVIEKVESKKTIKYNNVPIHRLTLREYLHFIFCKTLDLLPMRGEAFTLTLFNVRYFTDRYLAIGS